MAYYGHLATAYIEFCGVEKAGRGYKVYFRCAKNTLTTNASLKEIALSEVPKLLRSKNPNAVWCYNRDFSNSVVNLGIQDKQGIWEITQYCRGI